MPPDDDLLHHRPPLYHHFIVAARRISDPSRVRPAALALALPILVEWALAIVALRGRRALGRREIGRIHAHDAARTVDLHDAERHQRMLIAASEVDVEHNDFARVRIDEQLLHLSELASAYRAHLPAADVGLALGDIPLAHVLQRHEALSVPRVRSEEHTSELQSPVHLVC